VKQSCALIDHLRAIDKRRIRRIFGRISTSELAAIDQGLELFLGLGTRA
jgi:mRNA-degrading endonuclease toxin of MazEF toxin-antitoxin module